MTLKERMFYLIEKEGINPNQFYTKSGLGNGYLDKVGDSFRKPTIEKIRKSFPHWKNILAGCRKTKNIFTTHAAIRWSAYRLDII